MYVYRWSNAAWWPTMLVVKIRLPGKTHHPALAPATTQLSQTTHQPLNQSERTYVSDTDFSTNEEQEESQWGRWGRGRGGRRPFSLQCSCLRLKCTTWDLVTTVTARNTSHWASPDYQLSRVKTVSLSTVLMSISSVWGPCLLWRGMIIS